MARTRGFRILLAAGAAVVMGAAPATAAVVPTGHSGWSWSNPSPQGERISDIAFTGSTGYAVGDFGTLLRSTDAGATWTGLPSGTVQNLSRIGLVGPAGFVTSGGCAVRRSGDTGTTIAPVDVGGGDTGCGTTVVATAFADASNGLIVFATGVVLGTADGGVSLSRRTPLPGLPSDIVAVSPTTAFATSGNGVYRTTDAGGSWTLAAVAPRVLRSLSFATPTVAYAVGDGGTVLKSTDGGATWPAAPSPGGNPDLQKVRCADAQLCILTTSNTFVVRTADGGVTYTQVTAAANQVQAVAFASPTRVVAAGSSGETVLSDDGGVTWRAGGGALANASGSVTARPGGFAFATSTAAIALTSDGGATWRSVGIPTPRGIAVATFADAQTGYVQDDGGTLRRTVNGGASWQILDPGPAAGPLKDIVALTPTRILLITSGGVARSVDGGDTVTLVSSPLLRRSTVIRRGLLAAAGAGRRAYIAGRTGVLTSADGGATWTAIRLPRVGGRVPVIARADCIAPGGCWILTTGSRLYRLAGPRWREVTASVGVPLRNVGAIAALGPSEALLALQRTPSAVDDRGVVLATRDGGTSWAPQLVGGEPLTGIDAVRGAAWALTGSGRIFTTTTSGRTAVPSLLTITTSRKAVLAGQTVRVTGRLKGAEGGEEVTLYATGAAPRTLTVASSGTFSATLRITRATTLIAQWAGDGIRTGDGTPAVVVGLRR